MIQQPDPLKYVMDQLSATGGWDTLNNFGKAAQEQLGRQSEDEQREARIVIECFKTEAGQRCLEWLKSKTLLRGPNDDQRGAVTAEHYAIASARREGQNSIVFMILKALNFEDKAP